MKSTFSLSKRKSSTSVQMNYDYRINIQEDGAPSSKRRISPLRILSAKKKNFQDNNKYVLKQNGNSHFVPNFNLKRFLKPYYEDNVYG